MKTSRILTSGSMMLAAFAALASAYQPQITQLDMVRSENSPNQLYISYTLAPAADSKIKTNQEVTLTPVLTYAGGEVTLPPVIYAGRNAYLAHKRNDDTPRGAILVKADSNPRQFTEIIPWSDAYTQSQLSFRSETRGCRCKADGETVTLPATLAMDFSPKQFELIVPTEQLMAMEQPVAEVVKNRSLSRKAYVNYRVGSTVLLPDFGANPLELAKIIATIDSVSGDKDLTVDHVSIHGFASPEGFYKGNARLAEGRTEALRKYVDTRYGFGPMLQTGSTPEDWSGLREWVAASELSDKEALLKVIDSNLEPDAKDRKLKADFPASYNILLNQAYPLLRRADYRIDYTVRAFTEAATIDQLLQSDPSKLSFEELMLLARSYDEGSDRRSELVMQAAELFPEDERAQLNAAFTALGRGDLQSAERLLTKAGDSEIADYARGVLALYQGNTAEAERLLGKAAAAGVTGARQALKGLPTSGQKNS